MFLELKNLGKPTTLLKVVGFEFGTGYGAHHNLLVKQVSPV